MSSCVNSNYYFTLNSLTLFWLVESAQWIFEISPCDVITADYTIMMPRTLEVTGNHVKVLRFVLLFISEEAKTLLPSFIRSMYNKTIRFLRISRIITVSVRVIKLSWTLTSTLIILDITKTSSNNCLKYVTINRICSRFPSLIILLLWLAIETSFYEGDM